ncbi:hypothetical protein NIES2104_27330 [Leptolyngbya sp. NIES-2104]|nr:hypothetical protein NIES2104_27330 [Leptolyngbya sp. NIES-2104]
MHWIGESKKFTRSRFDILKYSKLFYALVWGSEREYGGRKLDRCNVV